MQKRTEHRSVLFYTVLRLNAFFLQAAKQLDKRQYQRAGGKVANGVRNVKANARGKPGKRHLKAQLEKAGKEGNTAKADKETKKELKAKDDEIKSLKAQLEALTKDKKAEADKDEKAEADTDGF